MSRPDRADIYYICQKIYTQEDPLQLQLQLRL